MSGGMRGITCFYCKQTFPSMTRLYRHRAGDRRVGRWCSR